MSLGSNADSTPLELGSLTTRNADETEALAISLGRFLTAGDVVVLSGALGAGKTTLTRGLAAGVGITDPVTSPTYAIAFTHENPTGGPNLVHVDAYRLTGLDDLETVDLDPQLPASITVIEWGAEYVESLADSWLEVQLIRDQATSSEAAADCGDDDRRNIVIRAHGNVRPKLTQQWQEVLGSPRSTAR